MTNKSKTLGFSWTLEERLKNINCSDELKSEINKYIDKQHGSCTGKRMSISNIMYRGNLHYIEDNINKKDLIDELRRSREVGRGGITISGGNYDKQKSRRIHAGTNQSS